MRSARKAATTLQGAGAECASTFSKVSAELPTGITTTKGEGASAQARKDKDAPLILHTETTHRNRSARAALPPPARLLTTCGPRNHRRARKATSQQKVARVRRLQSCSSARDRLARSSWPWMSGAVVRRLSRMPTGPGDRRRQPVRRRGAHVARTRLRSKGRAVRGRRFCVVVRPSSARLSIDSTRTRQRIQECFVVVPYLHAACFDPRDAVDGRHYIVRHSRGRPCTKHSPSGSQRFYLPCHGRNHRCLLAGDCSRRHSAAHRSRRR